MSPDGKDRENRGVGTKFALGLIAALVPPFAGNVRAAQYLYEKVKVDNPYIEWCVVRPDNLLDDPVGPFTVHETKPWSLFTPQKTNRANVGKFVADLVVDPALWNQWKGKFPLIFNA